MAASSAPLELETEHLGASLRVLVLGQGQISYQQTDSALNVIKSLAFLVSYALTASPFYSAAANSRNFSVTRAIVSPLQLTTASTNALRAMPVMVVARPPPETA